MPHIQFKVNGQVQLSRNLRVFINNASNLSDFYKGAINIIEKRTDSLFAKKGSNVEKGSKWKPLSNSTLKARRKRWGYYKQRPSKPSVLRWTGNLQDSRKKQFAEKYGSIEFTAFYAKYHQRGSKSLPSRPIIDISNKTNELIVKELQKKINTDMKIFSK